MEIAHRPIRRQRFFPYGHTWQEFQELSFSDSKDVGAYNARFKELRRKIEAAGLELPGQLYVIVYLQEVHATYPVWTECQRSYLRKYTAEELQGLKISYKTLENMMTDLVDESRVLNMQNENFNSNANGTALYGNRPPPPARGRGRNGHRKPTDMRTAADTDQNTDCNATQPSGKRHCNHCSKDGHMEDKCWIKNPSLRPKGHKKKDNAGGGALLGSTLFSSYSVTPIGHNSSDWILDTGASHHMCNDRQMFDEYQENENQDSTIVTAGANTRAAGFGSVKITVLKSDNTTLTVTLADVIHLPTLGINLLSGPRLRQKGVYIDGFTNTLRFQKDQTELCEFTDLQATMRIRTAVTGQALLAADQTIELWHRRLAHLGYDNVRKTATITDGMGI